MAADVANGCGRPMSNHSGHCPTSGQGEGLDHEARGQRSPCTHSRCIQVSEVILWNAHIIFTFRPTPCRKGLAFNCVYHALRFLPCFQSCCNPSCHPGCYLAILSWWYPSLLLLPCTCMLIIFLVVSSLKVVVAYWKVKTPCHAHGECIN